MVRLRGKSCPSPDRPSVRGGEGVKRALSPVLGPTLHVGPPPAAREPLRRRVWGQRPGQPHATLSLHATGVPGARPWMAGLQATIMFAGSAAGGDPSGVPAAVRERQDG